MVSVGTHPTFVYAKIFCLSVRSVRNKKSAVSQRHSMIQTKKIFRITLLKDSVTHARTNTQCGSNGRKSGYNNVDHHLPKFFLIHKVRN